MSRRDDDAARQWSRLAKVRADAGFVKDDSEWGRAEVERLRRLVAPFEDEPSSAVVSVPTQPSDHENIR